MQTVSDHTLAGWKPAVLGFETLTSTKGESAMQRFKAITRTEVVVIVVIIFILLGLLIPSASHSSGIYYLIRNGDLDLLRKQIQKENPSPESFPGFLNLAIRFEHLPICQYFIEELHTPLEEKHFVSGLESQNVEILLYLLEKGAPVDVNAKTDDGHNVQDLINDLLNDLDSKEESENEKKLKGILQLKQKHQTILSSPKK